MLLMTAIVNDNNNNNNNVIRHCIQCTNSLQRTANIAALVISMYLCRNQNMLQLGNIGSFEPHGSSAALRRSLFSKL